MVLQGAPGFVGTPRHARNCLERDLPQRAANPARPVCRLKRLGLAADRAAGVGITKRVLRRLAARLRMRLPMAGCALNEVCRALTPGGGPPRLTLLRQSVQLPSGLEG